MFATKPNRTNTSKTNEQNRQNSLRRLCRRCARRHCRHVGVGFLAAKENSGRRNTSETPKAEQQTPEPAPSAVALPQIPIPAGYAGHYLDDDGNVVYITQEELDMAMAFSAGETYTKEEAEQKAKEQAEKEWWESRQEWIDRFPFQPTHHPEITFDPEAYDPNNRPPLEERGKDYEQMRDLVQDHGFLRNFYESKLPYTEEFEQM